MHLMNQPEHIARDVILDSVADGVFTVDEDYRITSFNRAAELITGMESLQNPGNRGEGKFLPCQRAKTLVFPISANLGDHEGSRMP